MADVTPEDKVAFYDTVKGMLIAEGPWYRLEVVCLDGELQPRHWPWWEYSFAAEVIEAAKRLKADEVVGCRLDHRERPVIVARALHWESPAST